MATSDDERGGMTVREAGRKGGQAGGAKGGATTRDRHGREFYERIGKRGGGRVRDLVDAARRSGGFDDSNQ